MTAGENYHAYWFYTDSDLTISGESKYTEDGDEEIEKYDCKLTKGWNIIYTSHTESYDNLTGEYISLTSHTTQKPSGINFSWQFTGDGDDDDDGGSGSGSVLSITATNLNGGSSQIATVKAIAYWGDDDDEIVVAQAQYKNNGFTLNLPATMAAKYLYLISEDAPAGISISNRNAKGIGFGDIVGYDRYDDEIGYFGLVADKNDTYSMTLWLYVDVDVTIKGESKYSDTDYEETEKYDWKLTKGWNVVYITYTGSYNSSKGKYVSVYSYTSQKPSGMNFAWYFDDGSYYSPSKAAAKSIENTKSGFFSKLKENKKDRTRK